MGCFRYTCCYSGDHALHNTQLHGKLHYQTASSHQHFMDSAVNTFMDLLLWELHAAAHGGFGTHTLSETGCSETLELLTNYKSMECVCMFWNSHTLKLLQKHAHTFHGLGMGQQLQVNMHLLRGFTVFESPPHRTLP